MKGLVGVLIALVLAGVAAWYLFPTSRTAPPPGMTEVEIAPMEASVREELASRLDFYRDALLRGDMDALMSIYTSDARVNWTGGNLGRNDLQASMEEFAQTVTWTQYDVRVLDVFVHGDAAYGIYEISETGQMEGQEVDHTCRAQNPGIDAKVLDEETIVLKPAHRCAEGHNRQRALDLRSSGGFPSIT